MCEPDGAGDGTRGDVDRPETSPSSPVNTVVPGSRVCTVAGEPGVQPPCPFAKLQAIAPGPLVEVKVVGGPPPVSQQHPAEGQFLTHSAASIIIHAARLYTCMKEAAFGTIVESQYLRLSERWRWSWSWLGWLRLAVAEAAQGWQRLLC